MLERKVTLVDAQLILAALMVLPHAGVRAGVEALIECCERASHLRSSDAPNATALRELKGSVFAGLA